jgi:hypothetical protein
MMIYSPDIATAVYHERRRELEGSAQRYRLAKLARRGRTPHRTPPVRPAPAVRTRAA